MFSGLDCVLMMIDPGTLTTFRESLERCQANPHFLNRFYNNFVIANPVVREKFANTDMEKQKMMLHASLYMIALATQGNGAASLYLDKISKRHSKTDLDISNELYGLWLETLLKTVSEIDPDCSQTILSAWNDVMQFGIDFMQAGNNS